MKHRCYFCSSQCESRSLPLYLSGRFPRVWSPPPPPPHLERVKFLPPGEASLLGLRIRLRRSVRPVYRSFEEGAKFLASVGIGWRSLAASLILFGDEKAFVSSSVSAAVQQGRKEGRKGNIGSIRMWRRSRSERTLAM